MSKLNSNTMTQSLKKITVCLNYQPRIEFKMSWLRLATTHAQPMSNPKMVSMSIPVVKSLQKYFGDSIPIAIPTSKNGKSMRRSCCTGVTVVAPPLHSLNPQETNNFNQNIFNPNMNFSYNIKSKNKAKYISNSSPYDGLIYCFHSCIYDAIMVGSQTIVNEKNAILQYYYAPTHWPQLQSFNNLSNILKDQRELVKNYYKSTINSNNNDDNYNYKFRKYPANIIVTSGMNESNIEKIFLTTKIFTHENPFCDSNYNNHDHNNDDEEELYHELYIATSTDGAANIKKYLMNLLMNTNINIDSRTENIDDRNQRIESLKKRFETTGNGSIEKGIDKMLIVGSNCNDSNSNVKNKIDFNYLCEKFYNEYDIRCIDVEGGKSLMDEMMNQGCLDQLNLTFMHESMVQRKQFEKQEIETMLANNQFQIFDLDCDKWTQIGRIDYCNHDENDDKSKDCSLVMLVCSDLIK